MSTQRYTLWLTMTTTLSLNRTYTLQDGVINSITISDSNIDDTIIITQDDRQIFIPRAYVPDVSLILGHISRESI